MHVKKSCVLFPCLVLSSLSLLCVRLLRPCFPSSCVVLLVRPDGDVPLGEVTVSDLETLIQACFRDGLGGTVNHRQVSASHMPSKFGVKSIPVAGSSLEVVQPRAGRSCQPRTPRCPCVAKKSGLGKKLAKS